jgi:hypothetical protein
LKLWSSSLCIFLLPPVTLSLLITCPQTRSIFTPQYERPSSTPLKPKRCNHSFFNMCTNWEHNAVCFYITFSTVGFHGHLTKRSVHSSWSSWQRMFSYSARWVCTSPW